MRPGAVRPAGAVPVSGSRTPIRVAVAAAAETIRAGLEAMLASCEDLRVVSSDRPDDGLSRRESGPRRRHSGRSTGSPASRPDFDVLVVAEGRGLALGREAWGPPAGGGDSVPAYSGVRALVCLSEDPGAAARLASSGPPAWALLGPGAGREQLAAAVRAVHRGLVVLGPPLAPGWFPTRPAGRLQGRREGDAVGGSQGGPAGGLPGDPLGRSTGEGQAGEPPRLTPREREVLALLAQGLGNKQIAWELSVSEHTVKYHISSLYAKLGAGSRTEALRLGIERGLLSL